MSVFTVTALITTVKLLLIPAYHSTDFEVHRNWLAITHSLPISRWYYENTSEWTLDYPPFFAWFEYLLSFPAQLFDKNMLGLDNLNYESTKTVLFQRLSVIVTDLVYCFGVYRCCKTLKRSWKTDIVLPILLITNCGLIMVDHIHFQYNGFMYGILLISIAYMLTENYLKSAFWFVVLLNLKHIYLYAAPAYFIYLLKRYCLRNQSVRSAIIDRQCWINTCKLGSVVIGVFLISFLPFASHLPQIMSRLFPLKRGLCHAYWAPNIWALYNVLDKFLYILLSRLGYKFPITKGVMTGGLVQEYTHTILPTITPKITIILSILIIIPPMIKTYKSKNKFDFIRCIILSSLTSFLFGWHVHEKAILMAIIPLTILSVLETFDSKIFLILSVTGHYSLFPLLFPMNLLLVKTLLLLIYSIYSFNSLSQIYTLFICKYSLPLLNTLETLYLLGLTLIYLYDNVLHKLLGLRDELPFLPLLFTSVYCSIGVIYCWVRYYVYFLNSGVNEKIKNK